MSSGDIIAYKLEWFDTNSSTPVALRLNFFADNTIELIGVHDRKTFLKRIEYASLRRADLFLGNSVTIYNRVYTVVDYADEAARLALADREWHYLCVVSGGDVNRAHVLFQAAQQHGMSVGRVALADLVSASIPEVDFSGSTLLMEVVAQGSTPHLGAFERVLQSTFRNAQVVGVSLGEIETVFASATAPTVSEAYTLCLVKPHIVQANNTAAVIQAITEHGFDIVGLQKFHLNGSIAESFYGVYKGIIGNYGGHIAQACAGPSIALMLAKGTKLQDHQEHTAQLFRRACGPFDSEVAKTLRPDSLRAQFAQDRIRNAVHCTDIPEDGALECSFFFDVLTAL